MTTPPETLERELMTDLETLVERLVRGRGDASSSGGAS
jgi:hypothetical protein